MTALMSLIWGRAAAEIPVQMDSGPHYLEFFGQRYQTRADLYVFAFHGDVDHIYLGCRERRGLDELPAAVRRENVGKTFGEITILEVLPREATLTLKAETHETMRASGIREHGGIAMGFIVSASAPGIHFEGVLTEYLQTADSGPPRALNQRIDPAMAVRVK
jgi:hypothetical protein